MKIHPVGVGPCGHMARHLLWSQ